MKNEAQWLRIPHEAYENLSFSVGMRNDFVKLVRTIRECSILVRKPALDVTNALNRLRPQMPPVRYILYGLNGNGKSVSLHHVVYWAHVQKWIVCWFPKTYKYRRNAKECIQSTWKSGRIDLPEESSLWLTQFSKMNASLLDNPKLVTTKKYNWAPGEITEKGRPLTDLIKIGSTRIKTASDCMAALLRELKHYAKCEEIKLLLCIDQVNSLYGPTKLKRIDNYYAEPEDVTIMRAILDLLHANWNNGAIVASIDAIEKDQHLPGSPSTVNLPYYLLGRDGMNQLQPFVPVEVPPYTFEEAHSCVDFYVDRHWLINEKFQTPAGREEMFRLVDFNANLLERVCSGR